eukprot:4962204-Prymnesium_polylepis.1
MKPRAFSTNAPRHLGSNGFWRFRNCVRRIPHPTNQRRPGSADLIEPVCAEYPTNQRTSGGGSAQNTLEEYPTSQPTSGGGGVRRIPHQPANVGPGVRILLLPTRSAPRAAAPAGAAAAFSAAA